MSRGFFDNNKDSDSEAQAARRKDFLERMHRKLEYKELIANTGIDNGRI